MFKVETCSYSVELTDYEPNQDSCVETDIDFIYSYHWHGTGCHT
jgi:hypothetical protein